MNFEHFVYMFQRPFHCLKGFYAFTLSGMLKLFWMLLFSSWVSLLSVANLDPAYLQVELSQDDLMMLLKIPLENLGEASSLGHLSHKQDVSVHLQTSESSSTGMSVQTETDKCTNILFKVLHFPVLVDFRCTFSFSSCWKVVS